MPHEPPSLPPPQLLLLSLRSIISTSSSSTERNQEVDEGTAHFKRIGSGTCGTVYYMLGTGNTLKIANDSNSPWLWNDYVMHLGVSRAFEELGSNEFQIRVPRIHYYINKDDREWWNGNLNKFRTTGLMVQTSHAICAERILPLAKPIRESLIEQYCPAQHQDAMKRSETNKDCLVRVYLGRRRVETSRFFTLRNFILNLDQMEELKLDYMQFATSIAEALAILHWKVGIDANDVEFVLGSAPEYCTSISNNSSGSNFRPLAEDEAAAMPAYSSTWEGQHLNFRKRPTHLWLLDFNRCEKMGKNDRGVTQAVEAFFKNDPYYPRPHGKTAKDQELWATFRYKYLCTSAFYVGEREGHLPGAFISAIESEQKQRIEKRKQSMESRDY